MNVIQQMSLGFDSQSEAAQEALEPAPQFQARSKSARTAPKGGAANGSHAAMAKALDAHPDYRVLRRLMPRDDWGPAPASGTQRTIVLDTETTGLDAKRERIIELAMLSVLVDTSTGQPVGPVTVYESFEDPGKPIPQAITAITGIDDSMVRGQRIDDVRVNELVQAADLVLAHNAGFDRPFVEARLPVFETRAWNCSFAGIDWKSEGHGSAKLEFLAHERGWFYDAHRALVDCHALLRVLSDPLKNGKTALSQLLQSAAEICHRLHAVGAPFESKESLKSRGYRWDSEKRVWWINLSGHELLEQEMAWLSVNVYKNRHATVAVEELPATVQYSGRSGFVRDFRI